MAESHFLIDGYAAFHRAYHAIRGPMHSPLTGEPTNLVYGFTAMLLKLLREQKPDHLVVVIDASGDQGTFRSQIYPEYKAHRDPLPEDFKPQVERCLELLRDLGIPVVAIEGVEADDAIASLVARLRRERPEASIRIVSRDKDLSQLIDEKTALFDPQKDEFVDLERIFGRPGLEPRQVPDVLALMGDPVDNVPGVKGVGPKTAAELLLRFGTLDELLARVDEIPGKRGEAIREAKDSIPLARQLVELKRDLPIELDPEASRGDLPSADREKSVELLRTLGFGRLRDELAKLLGHDEPRPEVGPPSTTPKSVATHDGLFAQGGLFDDGGSAGEIGGFEVPSEVVRDGEALASLVERFRSATASRSPVAIDLETTGLAIHGSELCGLAIAFDGETGHYVPVRSPDPASHLSEAAVIEALRSPLEDPDATLLGHNLKFDLAMLLRVGVEPAGSLVDTMIESHLADPGDAGHGLKDAAERLLGVRPRRIGALIGEGRDQRSFAEVPLADAAPYAVQDVVLAWRLHERLSPRLASMGLTDLCRDVEFPLVAVLAHMEHRGIRVDPEELDRQRSVLEKELARLRQEILDAAPFPFNPDSPKQLASVLFGSPHGEPPGLGLRPIRRGKSGPSTDSETLERLAADPEIATPLPTLILEHRSLAKLIGTYLVALKNAIDPRTGRIHASFHQAATATGRLSSSDPNLQNIPIRTARGREIRKAFKAAEGCLLLAADYSQIELRMLAHLSGDPGLVEAFRADRDIHVAVAAEVFEVPPDQVTSEMRSVAKMVNFGIVYGITASGLARRLGPGTTRERATQIIATYKQRFAGIESFLDRCVQSARADGYVSTILGRRRPIPQIASRNPAERAFGERAAINTVVQGSAADLIKVAMVRLDRRLAEEAPHTRMLLQIHDELVLETPLAHLEEARGILVDTMERAMELAVPLRVDSSSAENWFDAG
jgi:DNA polymerase-1